LNYRKFEKLDVGLHFSSDNQQDFSRLTSIGLPVTYEILSKKDLPVFASLRPNIWNYDLFGNQFFAGETKWGFNADASVFCSWKLLDIGFSARNLIPIDFTASIGGVQLEPEFNIFTSYKLTEMFEVYNDLEIENSQVENLTGLKYNFEKLVSLYAQYNTLYGLSIGGSALLPIKRQYLKPGFYYGISNSASRKSQYAIQLEILF